jgi:hypothetical protein
VPILAPDSPEVTGIDAALNEWRQGDLALDESWFVHVGDPAEPLTDASAEAGAEGLQALTSEVAGLVVVTQTCDVVRTCLTRPYVEVSPLVPMRADDLLAVQRGRRTALLVHPPRHRRRLRGKELGRSARGVARVGDGSGPIHGGRRASRHARRTHGRGLRRKRSSRPRPSLVTRRTSSMTRVGRRRKDA